MLFRTIVLLGVLWLVVQNAECKSTGKLKAAIRNISKGLQTKRTTTPRPIPTIPTPTWKHLPRSSINTGSYGFVNPAGFGPPPLGFNSRGAVGLARPKYTSQDTGNSALGFFLGNSLAKVGGPSYHYYNTAYDSQGYLPKYDHYSVHHYYHNSHAIPNEAAIDNSAIVICAADSGSFCPPNTTSLCTNNGAVMCVTGIYSTVSCSFQTDERNIGCIRTTVPCQGNYSPECQRIFNGKASILMPCISRVTTFNPAQMYCVAVTVLPAERNMTKGEEAILQAEKILSAFVVRALGIATF